ncbi:MAG TPA: hypothetical protein VLB90_04545 [Pseudomonadales bacterium]|nr:hypothetical protein [Pseudomonadales bacterium]
MIDSQHFYELEQLITAGHYSDARHYVRSLLGMLQQQDISSSDREGSTRLAVELLSDTLDMLLFYRHESQITTYPIKAARLLFQGLSQTQ